MRDVGANYFSKSTVAGGVAECIRHRSMGWLTRAWGEEQKLLEQRKARVMVADMQLAVRVAVLQVL